MNLPQLAFGLGLGLRVGVVKPTGYFMLKVKFQESGPLLQRSQLAKYPAPAFFLAQLINQYDQIA